MQCPSGRAGWGFMRMCTARKEAPPPAPSEPEVHAKAHAPDIDQTVIGRDYYEVLGVARDASPDEIKRAYYKLAPQLHPDKLQPGEDGEAGDDGFKVLHSVYEALSNPESRKVYDLCGEAVLRGGRWQDNFFTFSPELSFEGARLTNNLLTATATRPGVLLATRGFFKGLRYWEFRIDTPPGLGGIRVGVYRREPNAKDSVPTNYLGFDRFGWGWFSCGTVENDNKYLVQNNPSMRFAEGDRVGILFNFKEGEARCYKNGKWVGKLSRSKFEVGRIIKARKGYAHAATFRWIEYYPAVTCAHTHYAVTAIPVPALPEWEAKMEEEPGRDWEFTSIRLSAKAKAKQVVDVL